jgi:hypothetical protein
VYESIIRHHRGLWSVLVPVLQVSLFFHLSGGGVVGLFRFSYK